MAQARHPGLISRSPYHWAELREQLATPTRLNLEHHAPTHLRADEQRGWRRKACSGDHAGKGDTLHAPARGGTDQVIGNSFLSTNRTNWRVSGKKWNDLEL